MHPKQLLAALLALMLSISPAMAAFCDASCGSAQLMSDTMLAPAADMSDCHQDHEPQPSEHTGGFHGDCGMAGCHTAAPTAFFETGAHQPTQDADTSHPQFTPTVVSADLPPPIKPPA